MKSKIVFFLLLTGILYMLFLDKNITANEDTVRLVEEEVIENPLLSRVLNKALSFKGVAYKFGGVTKEGMDCSGLVFTSYKEIDMTLARSSKNMYFEGEQVDLDKVKKGDLLFFDIMTFKDHVNHVGMVTSVNDFEINFIHSTDLKGVVVTSINEGEWKKAFIKAKRILK